MNYNIDELLAYFIELNYVDSVKADLYTSLALLNSFSLKYYDTEIVSILMNEDLIDVNEIKDLVYEIIKDKIKLVIKEHLININYENNPTLNELNEIVNFIYIIQNIENYDIVDYMLSSSLYTEEDNRRVLIDLISTYTVLDKIRLEELIQNVDDVFILGLKRFVQQRIEDTRDIVDVNYLRNFNYFLDFIENTNCLGKILFEKGYRNANLIDIVNLEDIDFSALYNENISNIPLFTLHCLSLLLLARDTYENPILYFNKNIDLFLENKEKSSLIVETMRKMVIDFNDFAKQRKQGYELNAEEK